MREDDYRKESGVWHYPLIRKCHAPPKGEMMVGKIIFEGDFDGEEEVPEFPKDFLWKVKLRDFIPSLYIGTIKVTVEYCPERTEMNG